MAKRVLNRSELDQLGSMWEAPGLKPTLVAVLAAFGGWSLLLPTIPQAILDGGGSNGLAGAYTGVFMAATVLTQTQTPRLLRSLGYGTTMFISGLFLGLPTLLHLFGTDMWLVLVIAVLRGMGFGALTVAESALIAELVPLKFLGKASGTLGLAVGIAQLVFLPLGLVMADYLGSYSAVYVVGTIVSLVGSAMALLIPRIKASPKATKSASTAKGDAAVATVPTWKLVLVPAIAMSSIAMGFGGISSFLAPAAREIDPAAGAIVGGLALSVLGGAQMVFRYLAGVYADRQSRAGLLLVPALLAGVVGLIAISGVAVAEWSAWLILVAAAVYGAGFGVVQNEALLLMFARLPRERNAEASAFWNISFDSGTGVGSFLLGFVAGVALHPYPAVFAVASCLVAGGALVAFMDRVVGKHRVAEYQNTRASLRKLGDAATDAVRTRRRKK
ncbi:MULTISPECIES: MFS transporter [unclassified Corynebacterium]|uniref:MFS transporter n=1 Tax=unclassified Corynebacterium TaxID=2624378 RepID=UPI0030B02569